MTSTTLPMNPAYETMRRWAGKRWLQGLAVLAAFVAVIGSVVGAGAPPAIASIALAAEPLYAQGARAKPTLTLALSVEFPTVGAQYVDAPGASTDASYSTANEYIGYFDPTSCYVYNDNPREALPAGATQADYKRFDRSGPATNHACSNAFSGNFMNWASSSAIDILRYGLTGGDRVVDTVGLTVLQRAVLPAGRFWNDQNFPSKHLTADKVAGAVPHALVGNYTGDVFVANCYNRIHFGTQATGSCDNPGNNSNLGTTVAAAGSEIGPVTSASSLPSGFTQCAGENGTCSFSGVMQVYYGANSSYRTAGATGPVACSNNVFGDPIVGTYKNCYVGPNASGWTPPAAAGGALTSGAFFYSRVSVCSVDNSNPPALTDPRTDLCQKYPNGGYKPVGNLQKFSDRIRVSAFGYLNDSTGDPNQRYGGVLRAPMKYVGPKYYDANFSLVSGTNPNREWDETTGVFIPNPDGQNTPSGTGGSPSGPALSGVTNYLNQFGRTGTFGSYKTYDAVGELYYEALRYLQGLPPTPAATVGLTNVMKDGYPVFSSWDDPHPAVAGSTNYSCVKNNIVAIGDVNTWNDKSFPGNPSSRGTNENTFSGGRPANEAGNEPDFHYWTQVVGGFEANVGVGYLDGRGVPRTTANFNTAISPENPWSDLSNLADRNIGAEGASYYMAGAAYWANTHDIRSAGWNDADKRRPGMRVKTYVLDVNEFAQQTSPSAHRRNQFYLASKYGGFDDASGTGSPYVDNQLNPINTAWERAGSPGETNNYYLASSATAVLNGLNAIFDSVANQANSIAGGAASSQRLTLANSYVYQAQFDPASWSGDLLAYAVTAAANNIVSVTALPAWSAAATLDAMATRKIIVGETTAAGGLTASDFLWNNLSTTAQDGLKSPQGISAGMPNDAAAGQARLNFLRGNRSDEAPSSLGFRKRTHLLGDIVNSGVAYSGAPTPRYNDPAYTTFYTANKDRKKALFVGANDGMLHAFDPDNAGTELFAYIPSWVLPRIGALTFPNYTHQSYVDATPVVGDALVGSAWKTVLVGGLGGGGQGVYALDVSNPGTFTAANVLWEFNDRDDPDFDLGNVVGKPQIVKLRVGPATAPVYKYFAMVASGVNNYVNDGHFSATGRSAIYLLDLSKRTSDAWVSGTNFFKISLPNPATGTGATANGLVGFSVVKGNADDVTQVYAGDLQGNLWKLDFTQAIAGTDDWTLSTLSFFKSGSTPIPMYIATDGASPSNAQPITMEPAIVYGPNKVRYVSFGTGKFLEVPDVQGPFLTQSVYTLLDNGSKDTDGGTAAAISGRGRLQAGTVQPGPGSVAISSFKWGRPTSDGDTETRSGWYFDFAAAGERQISNFGVLAGNPAPGAGSASGTLAFGSIIPPISSCDDGDGNIYSINVGTGAGTILRSPVGLLGEPLPQQVNDAKKEDIDSTGRMRITTHYQILVQGAKGLNAPIGASTDLISYAGRLSWREVSNYQQMRNAP